MTDTLSSSSLSESSTPPLRRVAIAGASGRMGRMLVEAVREAPDCRLAGALDMAGSNAIGADAAAFLGFTSGVPIVSDLRTGLQDAQVLIDFTRPEGTLAHLAICRELGVQAVIGTTGFSDAQKAEIAEIAKEIAIVMSPNMSVGVNVTFKLLEMAAKAMSTGYDIEIIEAHHRYKVEVVQGNFVSKEQVEALKPGMSRQQVREILGTSLLTDVFHKDRWDYVFTIRRQGVDPQERRLTVFFKGELLDRYEGDPMPSEEEFVATLDTRKKSGKVPQLEASEDELKKFSPKEGSKKADDATATATNLPPLPAAYPPLESAR